MGLLTAIRFLTIFPALVKPGSSETISRALPYFPVVGLLLGLILLALNYVLTLFLPVQVTAILLVTALVIMTGAHHIDGLIDTCDALVIGKSRQERLSIMADTRVGAFGITGACLLLIGKFTVLSNSMTFPGLLLMPSLARWAVVIAIVAFPAARSSGIGYSARLNAGWIHPIVASIISLIIVVSIYGLIRGCLLMIALLALISGLAALFNRMFGGLSGDCYGTLVEMSEVITMIIYISIADLWIFPDISLLKLVGAT